MTKKIFQDISNDTRETRLHYSSEKDGIFVVESKCGANQMNGSINRKTNNLIKASQQSILESNLKLNSDGDDHVQVTFRLKKKHFKILTVFCFQVHSPPITPPVTKTGLSQSTSSLQSSSTDSNHNYQYGGSRYYQVIEECNAGAHKYAPVIGISCAGGSRTQSSDTVNSCSSSFYEFSDISNLAIAIAVVDEKQFSNLSTNNTLTQNSLAIIILFKTKSPLKTLHLTLIHHIHS